MASTSYNTLTLSEEEPRKARSPAVYVVLGLAVVAMAGAAAAVFATGAGRAQVVVDVEYKAEQGMMASCDRLEPHYLQDLPKYDEEVTENPADFYNACYYGFRCCSTNNAECMTSVSLGESCKTCLKDHAPRMVRPWCYKYATRDGKNTYGTIDNVDIDEAERGAQAFTLKMLRDPATYDKDGVMVAEAMPDPKTDGLKYSKQLAENLAERLGGAGTCWPQPGDDDARVVSFAEKCFEVISWCNLLCPRDESNQNAHAMCKHCVLMDFTTHTGAIDQIKADTSKMLQQNVKADSDAAAKARKTFTDKYTVTVTE